jgi:hypothetical protein
MDPMIFSVDEAFDQFDEHGDVVSARSSGRGMGEQVWIRRSRNGEKVAEAVVDDVTVVEWDREEEVDEYLQQYADRSGFESWEDWKQKLEEMHGSLPNPVYFHVVRSKSESRFGADYSW